MHRMLFGKELPPVTDKCLIYTHLHVFFGKFMLIFSILDRINYRFYCCYVGNRNFVGERFRQHLIRLEVASKDVNDRVRWSLRYCVSSVLLVMLTMALLSLPSNTFILIAATISNSSNFSGSSGIFAPIHSMYLKKSNMYIIWPMQWCCESPTYL